MKIKITAADRKFSQAIKARDGYRCRACGKHYPPTTLKNKLALGVMHFFGRRDPVLRCDDRNAMAACTACHKWLDANPYWMVHFWRKSVGLPEFLRFITVVIKKPKYGKPERFEL